MRSMILPPFSRTAGSTVLDQSDHFGSADWPNGPIIDRNSSRGHWSFRLWKQLAIDYIWSWWFTLEKESWTWDKATSRYRMYTILNIVSSYRHSIDFEKFIKNKSHFWDTELEWIWDAYQYRGSGSVTLARIHNFSTGSCLGIASSSFQIRIRNTDTNTLHLANLHYSNYCFRCVKTLLTSNKVLYSDTYTHFCSNL
jgi:hypothetical protein